MMPCGGMGGGMSPRPGGGGISEGGLFCWVGGGGGGVIGLVPRFTELDLYLESNFLDDLQTSSNVMHLLQIVCKNKQE